MKGCRRIQWRLYRYPREGKAPTLFRLFIIFPRASVAFVRSSALQRNQSITHRGIRTNDSLASLVTCGEISIHYKYVPWSYIAHQRGFRPPPLRISLRFNTVTAVTVAIRLSAERGGHRTNCYRENLPRIDRHRAHKAPPTNATCRSSGSYYLPHPRSPLFSLS